MAAMPGVEAAEGVAPEERWARFGPFAGLSGLTRHIKPKHP
jgi:hypothetical protein